MLGFWINGARRRHCESELRMNRVLTATCIAILLLSACAGAPPPEPTGDDHQPQKIEGTDPTPCPQGTTTHIVTPDPGPAICPSGRGTSMYPRCASCSPDGHSCIPVCFSPSASCTMQGLFTCSKPKYTDTRVICDTPEMM